VGVFFLNTVYMLLFLFIESLFGVQPIRRNPFHRILKKYRCFVEKVVLRRPSFNLFIHSFYLTHAAWPIKHKSTHTYT